jgi:hypothetical protein
MEPLSMNRGPDGVALKHEATTLGVLESEHLLLILFLFSVPTEEGNEEEETPHA